MFDLDGISDILRVLKIHNNNLTKIEATLSNEVHATAVLPFALNGY